MSSDDRIGVKEMVRIEIYLYMYLYTGHSWVTRNQSDKFSDTFAHVL